MIRKSKLGAAVVGIVAAIALLAAQPATADHGGSSVVGTWTVTAAGAQYPPHLFQFSSDRTMLTTNPTNVQERVDAPHGGTNDSVGMGAWKARGNGVFTGKFLQLNAFADNHLPAGTLVVTFTIRVRGDHFEGPALATVDGEAHEATLTGDRVKP
jgi:hypothetical protein